jgi:hypothetical protein
MQPINSGNNEAKVAYTKDRLKKTITSPHNSKEI